MNDYEPKSNEIFACVKEFTARLESVDDPAILRQSATFYYELTRSYFGQLVVMEQRHKTLKRDLFVAQICFALMGLIVASDLLL